MALHLIAECTILNAALAHCREVSGHKETLVVLGFTKLSLVGNSLTLEASDLRISLRTTITVDGRSDGCALLNTQRLADIVKALPSGSQIEIMPDTANTDSGAYILKSGRSRYRLPSLDEADWPEFPDVDGGAELHTGLADLRRLIGKTAPFVGTDAAKRAIYGHYFARIGEKIRMVGCNGQIMAIVDINAPEGTPDFESVVIAPETARIVHKLVDDDVEIRFSLEKIAFSWGQSTLISKLVEAIYPDYEKLIPRKRGTSIVVNAAEARDAVRRAAMISDDAIYNGSKAVRLTPGEDILTISAAGANGEEGDEIISAASVAGGAWGFNARNLLTVFEAGGTDSITMQLSGRLDPILLLPDSDPDVQIVAAPMALKGDV